MNYRIAKELNESYKSHINHKLYENNLSHFPEDLRGRYKELNFVLLDEDEKVRGGILGEVCWNWPGDPHTYDR